MLSLQDNVRDGGGQTQPARRIRGDLRGRMQAGVHGQVLTALLLHGKHRLRNGKSQQQQRSETPTSPLLGAVLEGYPGLALDANVCLDTRAVSLF